MVMPSLAIVKALFGAVQGAWEAAYHDSLVKTLFRREPTWVSHLRSSCILGVPCYEYSFIKGVARIPCLIGSKAKAKHACVFRSGRADAGRSGAGRRP